MNGVIQVECRSCGARTSGVRTAFGSLVVPGRRKCPRCGATEFAEAAGEGAPAGTDSQVVIESGIDPEATKIDSEEGVTHAPDGADGRAEGERHSPRGRE